MRKRACHDHPFTELGVNHGNSITVHSANFWYTEATAVWSDIMSTAVGLDVVPQAVAEHMLERVSQKNAAHGVQAFQPCLADAFSSDRESSFIKAECWKTAGSVCAAAGGKPFSGRLLRPDTIRD
jgi:hypothetical protein